MVFQRNMTQAELRAEFDEIRKAFRHDIIPSLDAIKPLIGTSMPTVVRRTYERLDAALMTASEQQAQAFAMAQERAAETLRAFADETRKEDFRDAELVERCRALVLGVRP